MGASLLSTVQLSPDWIVGEMPPGYQNRVAEIVRLTADLQDMSRFTHLLTEAGAPLREAVRDAFTSLGFTVETVAGAADPGLRVSVGGGTHLLVHVAAGAEVVQKKSVEVGAAFHLLQEVAGEHDRVVLVTNTDADKRPAERGDALSAEAAAFLQRLGATHVTAATLFSLWKLSLQEPARARDQVARMHDQDGGTFQLPANALL